MKKCFKMDYTKIVLAFTLVVLVALALSCAALDQVPGQATATASPSSTPTATASATPTATAVPSVTATASPIIPTWTPPPLSQAALPADLSDIVARVLPSVVSINVEVTSTNFMGQSTTQQGAGSGWIIDASGLIVTNNHVVEGAQNITVSLNDGRVLPAQQISADPVSDLAVIKINATGLTVATIGDSSKLKPGMMVIAIGNALGQGISVTAGWVSRLGVSLSVPASATTSAATLFDLVEVSTPINPGNSGGPLVDTLGEVVGITNVKLVQTGVENVGYAISTISARPILQQLVQTGSVVRPYLGVSVQDVDPTIASIYGLAVTQGAIITRVDPGGPASQAGLQPGDVIVAIDNTTVASAADAVQAILNGQIGQPVTVTYYRGSSHLTATATLVQNPNP
jgi:serine protease Do